MVVWIGRGLGMVGAIAFAAGLANVLMPTAAFPSGKTCVTDYDLTICRIEPWAAGLWLVLAGGVAITIAVAVVRERHGPRPEPDRGEVVLDKHTS